MRIRNYFFAVISVGFIGCSPLEDPNMISDNDVLTVVPKDGRTEISGLSVARTVILARLPEGAGTVDVSFSTTSGKFVYSDDKAIKELADSVSGPFRYATAVLQTEVLAAADPKKYFYVTAEVAGSRDRLTLTLVK